jgi:AcrR family transcriptional regulator
MSRLDAKSLILDATARLMERNGVRAVSMDDIAAAAGFTKRTVYYHFATKEELVTAWLSRRSENTSSHKGEIIADPVAAILSLFSDLVSHIETSEFCGCPFVLTTSELFGESHAALGVARNHKRQRLQWFEEQADKSGASDPKVLAQQLMVIWEGAWASSLVMGNPDLAKIALALVRQLLPDNMTQH